MKNDERVDLEQKLHALETAASDVQSTLRERHPALSERDVDYVIETLTAVRKSLRESYDLAYRYEPLAAE